MLRNTVERILRAGILNSCYSSLREGFNRVRWGHFGASKYCPVCEKYSRKFQSFGTCGSSRPDARCTFCGSLERHRLVWAFFYDRTDLFDDSTSKRMLQISPGPFADVLREEQGIDYLSGDIDEGKAMEKVDVTDIQYPADTFDVVYASHVLEHIPDDRKAMREIRRVLAPDGWAVLLVPITAEETFGDSSITDPEERVRLFGQHDHVRRYGPDFKDRLEEAGFDVTRYSAPEVVEEENVQRMGLKRMGAVDEKIHFCRK